RDVKTGEHAIPRLSIDNTYNRDELNDFDRRVQEGLGHSDSNYLVELKFDGASLRLRYGDGNIALRATRGDGEKRDDITRNIKTIRDIPLQLNNNPHEIVEVRGEDYKKHE